ncbi:MAG: UDP-N-acetylmuramoyl-tripeptide--D-alanyl-D-alanine ligase [Chitinophagales bacterium]|nr:UDP-N-acetylmuramoyl-tripeptide--D-alanyl-D-alanine ligase [Chitinophagales bacterium]MDW8419384.1 UDP-N-acetylmuramoyl-tripeptide--D-alanyl-D-alanine ligase [Chitinophagales bacterium]
MSIEQLYELYLKSSGVTTDTRSIQPRNIFFALRGEKFNGNHFAEAAIQAGALCAVVDELTEPEWAQKYPGSIIQVHNVLYTLQQLAKHHRSQFRFPVIAITGSNGKTTTKELIAAVLAKKFRTAYTRGNLNNHIGIPLTLLSIDASLTEIAVIEMGANHQGEIASYCEYVQPDYGLITNVGMAHVEGFGGFAGVVKGKTELYRHIADHSGKLFLNADDDVLIERARYLLGSGFEERVILYGTSPDVYCSGKLLPGGEFLKLEALHTTFHTNLIGDYNFTNVLSAICIGKYFHVPVDSIREAIAQYVPTNNRSQKMSWGTNTVILDAYNANPTSMQAALKNFLHLPGDYENRVVILGEMMELGDYSAEEHKRIFDLVEPMPVQYKVFVGEQFAFTAHHSGVLWFPHTAGAREWLHSTELHHSLILVKGSRANGLEKLFT